MSKPFEIESYLSPRAAALLILGGALALLAGLGVVRDARLLQRDGKVAEAQVTEHKEARGRSGSISYSVRYSFQPPSSAKTVTRGDMFGRSNLWVSLPKDEYDKAVAAGTLQILYVPANPAISTPVVKQPDASQSWPLFLLGAGLVLAAVAGWLVKGRRAPDGAPAMMDEERLAKVVALPPMELLAARSSHLAALVMAGLPLGALGLFLLLKTQGQALYGAIAILLGLCCHLNVAFIRLRFDGRQVLYTSLIKRTAVMLSEVTGAKIGCLPSARHTAFFFLTTVSRGDVMLNLRVFERKDAREFCARLSMLEILPKIEDARAARRLALELYPDRQV